eukprot:g4976.t1
MICFLSFALFVTAAPALDDPVVDDPVAVTRGCGWPAARVWLSWAADTVAAAPTFDRQESYADHLFGHPLAWSHGLPTHAANWLQRVTDAALASHPAPLAPSGCERVLRALTGAGAAGCPAWEWEAGGATARRFARVAGFVSELARAVHASVGVHESPMRESGPPLRVLVVGGGPAGLLHAVEAALHTRALQVGVEVGAGGTAGTGVSMHVTVLEKRDAWTRNTWFDLVPESADPSSVTLAVLTKWGFAHLRPALQLQEHAGTPIVSIRCALLEQFLARVLRVALSVATGTKCGGDGGGGGSDARHLICDASAAAHACDVSGSSAVVHAARALATAAATANTTLALATAHAAAAARAGAGGAGAGADAAAAAILA